MARKAKKPEQESAEAKTITAYKGFDADFRCRGFQYEVGKSYTHDGDVSICAAGFHACENPFDVWGYYDMIDSRFALVELTGETDSNDEGDTKIAAAEITIKAELTLPEFIKNAVNWIVDATKSKDESGHSARIGSSGNSAQIDASGENAVIASAGYSARVKAKAGAWVSVAEFGDDGKCVGFATGCVGKDGIPDDTWLIAKGGELVPEAA